MQIKLILRDISRQRADDPYKNGSIEGRVM
jgi:hypothetical protein